MILIIKNIRNTQVLNIYIERILYMESKDAQIFEILENIIKNVNIEEFNIYDVCEK